ncbi:ATPase, partial [bacterium]
IFLKDGEVKNVYELSLTVKVPTGMTEADLTRPVVEVRDFETGKLYYEIYTYGEENVVVPIEEEKTSAIQELAKQRVLQAIKKYDSKAEIYFTSKDRVTIKVRNECIPRLIGKEGMNISRIEDELGIHIDVEPKVPTTGREVKYVLEELGNNIVLRFGKGMKGKLVNIYVDEKYLLSGTVGKKNEIRISKSSEVGNELLKALVGKKKIRVLSV